MADGQTICGSGFLDRDPCLPAGGRASLARTLNASLSAKSETPCHSLGLTPRELDVIAELVLGGTNRRIAGDLAISAQTVKRRVANIFDKLGLSSRLEVALFAVHHQLIDRHIPLGRPSVPKC